MRKPPKKSLYPGSRSLIVVMPSRAVPSRVCSSCPHTNPIIWASGTHTTPPRTDGRTGEIDVGQVGGSQVGEEAEACNRNFVSLIRRVLCAQTAPSLCKAFVLVLSIAAQMIYRSLIFINVSGESRPPRPPRPRVHLHATHTHTLRHSEYNKTKQKLSPLDVGGYTLQNDNGQTHTDFTACSPACTNLAEIRAAARPNIPLRGRGRGMDDAKLSHPLARTHSRAMLARLYAH